jgi:hypothetical protein
MELEVSNAPELRVNQRWSAPGRSKMVVFIVLFVSLAILRLTGLLGVAALDNWNVRYASRFA